MFSYNNIPKPHLFGFYGTRSVPGNILIEMVNQISRFFFVTNNTSKAERHKFPFTGMRVTETMCRVKTFPVSLFSAIRIR